MEKSLTWNDLKPLLKNTIKEINDFENRFNIGDGPFLVSDPDRFEYFITDKGLCCREKEPTTTGRKLR